MNYSAAKKKLETLLAGMKRDWQNYAADPDASKRAIHKKADVINTIIQYLNAADRHIALLEGRNIEDQASTYIRDEALETAVLDYFALNIPNTYPLDRISDFCKALHKTGQLDWFKTQFKFYVAFKNITGFKHGFYSFLGTEEKQFADGKWNAFNWEQQLFDHKKKNLNGKNHQRGDTPKTGYGSI